MARYVVRARTASGFAWSYAYRPGAAAHYWLHWALPDVPDWAMRFQTRDRALAVAHRLSRRTDVTFRPKLAP